MNFQGAFLIALMLPCVIFYKDDPPTPSSIVGEKKKEKEMPFLKVIEKLRNKLFSKKLI